MFKLRLKMRCRVGTFTVFTRLFALIPRTIACMSPFHLAGFHLSATTLRKGALAQISRHKPGLNNRINVASLWLELTDNVSKHPVRPGFVFRLLSVLVVIKP